MLGFNFNYHFAIAVPCAELLGGALADGAGGGSLHPSSHAVVVEEVAAIGGTDVMYFDPIEAHDALGLWLKEKQTLPGPAPVVVLPPAVLVQRRVARENVEMAFAVVEPAVRVWTGELAAFPSRDCVRIALQVDKLQRRLIGTRLCEFDSRGDRLVIVVGRFASSLLS